MKYHIQLCLWALAVLWKQKTITIANRLRLWRKTINLFLCFAAFADKEKPRIQLHGAMISALLSAIYDYETDWIAISSVETSIYRKMLCEYVPDPSAQKIGWDLFEDDRKGKLSRDGLERGSIALTFYQAVIGSKWLARYTADEINEFGRMLQAVDDLLDLEEDTTNGHTNCFLSDNRERYLQEVREFIKGEFCKTLERHSMVYYRICIRLFKPRVEGKLASWQLALSCRPHTEAFAFVLTLVGFKLAGIAWMFALLAAFIFAGLTLSIMALNDLLDKERDEKKGKVLASQYPWHVFRVWKWASGLTAALLILESISSWRTALFSVVVWMLGMLYSVIRPRYPFNNLLVALCAASPVLAGMIYTQRWETRSVLVFGVIFSTILVTEAVKDIQDVDGDRGYKDTLATKVGRTGAILRTIPLCFVPTGAALFFPNQGVRMTAICFAVVIFCLGLSLTRSHVILWAERAADVFLGALLIVLMFIK